MSHSEQATTDDTSLQPAVAAEFASLAGLLADASRAQWDTWSLCADWRVREVIAHLTMAARYPEQEFMAELRRCDFDFTRLSNEIASRDASLPEDQLVACLRSDVMKHWTPPGGGYHGALNHVVIHGLDVTVPLGVRRPPDEAIRVVLDYLTADGGSNGRACTISTTSQPCAARNSAIRSTARPGSAIARAPAASSNTRIRCPAGRSSINARQGQGEANERNHARQRP